MAPCRLFIFNFRRSASCLGRSISVCNESVMRGQTMMIKDLIFPILMPGLTSSQSCRRASADEPQQQQLFQLTKLQLCCYRLEHYLCRAQHHLCRARRLRRRNQLWVTVGKPLKISFALLAGLGSSVGIKEISEVHFCHALRHMKYLIDYVI